MALEIYFKTISGSRPVRTKKWMRAEVISRQPTNSPALKTAARKFLLSDEDVAIKKAGPKTGGVYFFLVYKISIDLNSLPSFEFCPNISRRWWSLSITVNTSR